MGHQTKSSDFAVAGAGFSGAVMARELVRHTDRRVVVFEERNHIAGNCHTRRDEQTGVMEHVYGSHIFHTSRDDVWNYVNTYGQFMPMVHRVKATTAKGVFSLPINLLTLNHFFHKQMNPRQAREWINEIRDRSIQEPKNFEEQALASVGRDIYENFFHGYTQKQWGCDPREIPASVLKRLPLRFTYDDNYYTDTYQGMPCHGYTANVQRMLDHPRIEVRLNQKLTRDACADFNHVFYTGPIDGFFDYQLGSLGYRTVDFLSHRAEGDFQGTSVMNYTDGAVPYTRIHEYKHFAPWEKHDQTLYHVEFSRTTDAHSLPFYPLCQKDDMQRLDGYRKLVMMEPNISFLGRLGTYRYLDMHRVIEEALDFSQVFCKAVRDNSNRPHFPLDFQSGGQQTRKTAPIPNGT